MICIYKIISPSNKIYIGSTNNYKRRKSEYKYLGCKEQTRLYNSLIKYGFENHSMEVIEECCITTIYLRERYWQEYYKCINKNGLNCHYVNTNNKPKVTSSYTKDKQSLSQSGSKNARFGVKVTDEIRQKISKANKGKIISQKQRDAQSMFMKNNTISKSTTVINVKTKEIFNSIRKAAINNNINYSTLKKYLSGELKNKSNLKYNDTK